MLSASVFPSILINGHSKFVVDVEVTSDNIYRFVVREPHRYVDCDGEIIYTTRDYEIIVRSPIIEIKDDVTCFWDRPKWSTKIGRTRWRIENPCFSF